MTIWQILGIGPTSDSKEIRRAYAARLKVTRPEDDPQAYQALHEAYQLALQDAKSGMQAQSEVISAPPINAGLPPATELAGTSSGTANETNTTVAEPDRLVEHLLTIWRSEGDAALVDTWPHLERQLHSVALNRTDDYAIELADMLLDHPKLPAQFANHLVNWFDWGNDFRLANKLGPSRAEALQEALVRVAFDMNMLDLKIRLAQENATNAATAAQRAQANAKIEAQQKREFIRQRYDMAARFARMISPETTPRSRWCAMMAGAPLYRDWLTLDTEQCDLLGIDQATLLRGKLQLAWAAAVRTQVTGLLILLAMSWQLLGGAHFGLGVVIAMMASLACHYLPLGKWLETARQMVYPTRFMLKYVSQSAQEPMYIRLISMFACLHAFSLSRVFDSVATDENAPIFLTIICILLFIAWITEQDAKSPAVVMAPAVFVLCAFLIDEARNTLLFTLTLAALWNSISSSTRVSPWGGVILSIWILTGLIGFINGNDILLYWVCSALPWLLYEIARHESPAGAFAIIGLGLASFPPVDTKFHALWIGMVALLWILVSMLLRALAQRAMPIPVWPKSTID